MNTMQLVLKSKSYMIFYNYLMSIIMTKFFRKEHLYIFIDLTWPKKGTPLPYKVLFIISF